MGRYSFNDIKDYIEYSKTGSKAGYTFPLLPQYNKIIGNLQQKQTHIVSGMGSSGVSSFIDQNYVIGVLLQWYNIAPNERPPLRIFYYSMSTSELKKYQLLLCNYIKLVYNLHVDIPTLNSQIGKLYDIEEDEPLQEAIEKASIFFDEVMDAGALVINDGLKTPTDVYNDVIGFLDTKGTKTSKKQFDYEEEYQNLMTIVIVDSIDSFSPDTDGYGVVSGDKLDDKFKKYVSELKAMYGVTTVLAVPSKLGYVRSVKDTEPHIRHLGSYEKLADKAVCIYNPIAEKNVKFYNSAEDVYTTEKGNVLLRTWHVVRNVDGIDSTYDRMFFLPGTSFMIEHSKLLVVDDISEVIQGLDKPSIFHT